jgi:TatD DNase family protein
MSDSMHDERSPRLIDSHCHIDMPEFDHDRDAVVERAREAGVERMLIVGELDEELGLGGVTRAVEIAERYGFACSGGVHPHQARLFDDRAEDLLRGLARERRIAAIGEIGLDFHYDYSPRDAQDDAFRRQLRLAHEVGLPVIVHTREADAETALILEHEEADEIGGAIHCFTGGRELAERALVLGFCISFSGIVAFPRAAGIQEVARTVPIERLLVETDAPFLAPPPHRGKRNEPAFVVEVARRVAELRGMALEDLAEAVSGNFRRLLAGASKTS